MRMGGNQKAIPNSTSTREPEDFAPTCFVRRVLGQSTVSIHLREVQRAVETAGKVGDIDVKGKLPVQGLEEMVLGGRVQEVQTGADVGVGSLRDEIDLERVARGGNTVSARVISTIESAVRSSGTGGRSNRRVPGVAGVAVGRRTTEYFVRRS